MDLVNDQAKFASKPELWTLKQLYAAYQDNQIVKPTIQRKLRWKETDIAKYNNYFMSTFNGGYPLLFTEIIRHGRKEYLVVDGNNRINASVAFVQTPLKYLNGWIPSNAKPIIRDLLQTKSLDFLLKCPDFEKFCKKENQLEYYKSIEHTSLLDDFDEIFDALLGSQVWDIKFQVNIFDHAGYSEMKWIFENINTGGIRLTEQEMLATKTYDDPYSTNTVRNSSELVTVLDNVHYKKGDEVLLYTERREGVLSRFEILQATNILYTKKYTWFTTRKNAKNDIIFSFFDLVVGSADKEWHIDVINKFLEEAHCVLCIINKLIQDYNCKISLPGNRIVNMMYLVYCTRQKHVDLTEEQMELFRRCIEYDEMYRMFSRFDGIEMQKLNVLVTLKGQKNTANAKRIMEDVQLPSTIDLDKIHMLASKLTDLSAEKTKKLVCFEHVNKKRKR